jgi:hypothetical protein
MGDSVRGEVALVAKSDGLTHHEQHQCVRVAEHICNCTSEGVVAAPSVLGSDPFSENRIGNEGRPQRTPDEVRPDVVETQLRDSSRAFRRGQGILQGQDTETIVRSD